MPLLRFTGFGTEKVESETAAHFPGARIARMDADSVRKRGSHEEILRRFRDHQIDILIGTQMIAKGFDFPHVTLVGVVLADVGLSLPDFRSAERTFQLMTQVAGRAGRGKNPGRVIIQTFSPEHPSIVFAQKHDYPSFYAHEAGERRHYGYPPFKRLLNVIIRSHNESKAYQFSREFRDALKEKFAAETETEIIGPAPLPFYKLRGHYRWHVMLKLPLAQDSTGSVRETLDRLKKPSDVAFALDVDPLNIL
jgi:primosomal protein N' (replication factor Y)